MRNADGVKQFVFGMIDVEGICKHCNFMIQAIGKLNVSHEGIPKAGDVGDVFR